MTGFELEALRRLLFFSPPEAATLISQTSEQAWRRWESGSRKVPEDVEQRITDLIEWRQAAIDATVKQISAAPNEAFIALIWYDSMDDWATLPGREPALWRPQQSVCAAVFSEFPGRLRLVRFDAPAYSAWLAGRPEILIDDLRIYETGDYEDGGLPDDTPGNPTEHGADWIRYLFAETHEAKAIYLDQGYLLLLPKAK